MQVDYSIDLGAEDPTLDLPWATPDGGPSYVDLKRHPELMAEIAEATAVGELGRFLATLNSPTGRLESAKCDTWSTIEMDPEEEIFAARRKFGSYVDLVFSGDDRFSFNAHEDLVKRLTELLQRAPEIPALAEFMVRRAFYWGNNVREGFYVTFYLFGYGNDETHARRQWGIALQLVENAIRQASSAIPESSG